ncbi:MAG TPA: hypothetical protein PL048_11020 [Leptospiraceae bacterium]|nr:hypothetical protein [Leptospiraceae bacterium]HMZ59300.1 hypothetical protein [Leptospiraceae bacterium]HNF14250.1 hypothetical protein [Leptospiraceae bacterium]HNF25697.1 hypothetical protein [Leptospiraceae bacterium]HNH07257.1 hypothetical protein [Leptospiraceae bacterium]
MDISPPVSAVISNSAISADIPSSVSLAALAPTLEITGTSILADGKVQENGKTNNDFRKPVSYSILAEDGSKSDYTVTLNNTGFSILGSSGNVNITGLSASDAALEMYYDTSGNYFSAFDSNTKIGTVLPNTTNFALSFKSMPTGKTCSLTAGTTSGILSSDVSFSVNCVSGYLVGGKILSRLSTFTVGANSASVTTVAGSMPPAASPGTTDGIGGAARLSTPVGVTSDGKDLYIADSGNHCIRKYEISTGNVTTLAGLCGTSGTADGTGTSARFNFPIQISSDGTNLFICDRANNMIRKTEISTGNVTTLIGSGGASGDQNGIGTSARINFPNGITTDGNYLYISDRGNNKIKRMMISSGVVTTVAGDGTPASVDSANGLTASLNVPCDSVSVSGILYFVDCNGNTLRKIQLSSPFPVSTIAGSGAAASIDGTGLSASFNNPHGIETDGTNLFITEYNGKKIRRVGISGLNTVTLAGSAGYQDGTGTGAFLGNLGGITTDGNRLYFVDPTNHALRRIDNPPD